MKKMLEELRELNNEEIYDVPVDFRENVINRIKVEKKASKYKYIISSISVAAVMLIAVVFGRGFTHKDLNNSEQNNFFAEADQSKQYDVMPTHSAVTNGIMQDTTKGMTEEREEAANKISSEAYYNEIVDMLKINGIEAVYENNEVKAKASKEKVEEVLFYFEGEVSLTKKGEYVIIKEL